MARVIPSDVQALLDNPNGEEEIIIVLEIFWNRQEAAGTPLPANSRSLFYADRKISGAPYVNSSILSLPPVDAAVQIAQGGQSKSLSVLMDDTGIKGDDPGAIKRIFDVSDPHKAPVRVWFYVLGTDFETKKFPIFLGQINSPVEWLEGQRTFSFNIVNRIEDVEVGFSAEEGAFPQLPEDLIGVPWPLCFGTTINVPSVKSIPATSGLLLGGVGIRDFTLARRIQLAENITCPETPIGFKCITTGGGIAYTATCNIAFETDANCLQSRCVELETLRLQFAEQGSLEFATIRVQGGENFPQGTRITLNINGGLFTGSFDGTPSARSNVFKITNRRHPKFDTATGGIITDPVEQQIASACPGGSLTAEDSNFTDSAFGPLWTGYRDSRISWDNYRREKAANFFWAGGGSTVTLENVKEIIYIANIVPSTILAVRAWRTLNGNRFLLTVPDEFFTVRQTDFNGYQVMEIIFQKPLSEEQDEGGGGWEDDIFITQISSVGPNTVDIVRFFIETYTTYAIDNTSFDAVKVQLENYPMHFPLLTRPGLLSILQNIARKARCAIWQRDDTFFIKYLAIDPVIEATIVEDDILQDDTGVGTLNITLTKTELLITKHTSTWRKDYSIDEPNKLILRHNVSKYGTHATTEDYLPFAHLDLVRKSATFWLIRSANTWKRLKFNTSLQFAKLEPHDAVTVNLPDVASVPFTAIVERADLDSSGKQMNMELWTPIRAGELLPYPFAFPADIAESALFPTIEARNAGQAGSNTQPNFSVIAPPGHPLESGTTGVFSGFSLGCNGAGVVSLKPGECRQDHGDRNPSDVGDKKPTVDVEADGTGKVSGGTSPISKGAGTGSTSNLQNVKNQTNKVEGDAGRSRELGESGGSSSDISQPSSNPVNNEFLNSLPDPDDLTAPCQISVTVTGFATESSFGGVPTREACVPVPGDAGKSFTDIYVFDSAGGAFNFCNNVGSSSACGGLPPCGMCVNSCVLSGSCVPGTEGDGSIIGFRGGNSAFTFMAGAN